MYFQLEGATMVFAILRIFILHIYLFQTISSLGAKETLIIRKNHISFSEFVSLFERAHQLGSKRNLQIHFTSQQSDEALPPYNRWEPEFWGDVNSPRINYTIGHLEATPTEKEMKKFYNVIKWGLSAGFAMMLDPFTTVEDLREVIAQKTTSVVIWSSHGSSNGAVYDANEVQLPYGIFLEGDPKNYRRQFILSNCFSDQTIKKYSWPGQSSQVYWEGTTDATELFDYLMSDRWNADLRELGHQL